MEWGLLISDTDFIVAEELPASNHASYTTIAVRECKRVKSSTIARSPKTRGLNTATGAATGAVKEADVLDDAEAAKSSQLSPEAVAAQESLLQAMMIVYSVYNKIFRKLNKTHELKGGEDLGGMADSLLCDPPYNVRSQQDLQNSYHDIFIAKDMEEFCELVANVLNRRR